MNSDCSDIRFTYLNSTDNTEIEIPYWIESDCNTTNTRIWVKVPFIQANSPETIYVYYGNSSATSLSDSAKVFGKTVNLVYNRDNYYLALILANREWISGGTNLGISGDDSGASRTLPFPVIVYGTSISAVYLSTNGLLRWDNVADTRYSNSLDTANKILTAHWDDLYISTTYRSDAGIYEITGSDVLGDYVAYRWATTYYSSTSTPADFEILLYKNGYIQFNILRLWSSATPNEFISRGDRTNYIDLTPRWTYMESVLFVPRAYPEPTITIGNEETFFALNVLSLSLSKTEKTFFKKFISFSYFSSIYQKTISLPFANLIDIKSIFNKNIIISRNFLDFIQISSILQRYESIIRKFSSSINLKSIFGRYYQYEKYGILSFISSYQKSIGKIEISKYYIIGKIEKNVKITRKFVGFINLNAIFGKTIFKKFTSLNYITYEIKKSITKNFINFIYSFDIFSKNINIIKDFKNFIELFSTYTKLTFKKFISFSYFSSIYQKTISLPFANLIDIKSIFNKNIIIPNINLIDLKDVLNKNIIISRNFLDFIREISYFSKIRIKTFTSTFLLIEEFKTRLKSVREIVQKINYLPIIIISAPIKLIFEVSSPPYQIIKEIESTYSYIAFSAFIIIIFAFIYLRILRWKRLKK